MRLKNKIAIFWGIGSGLALLLFYFLILTLVNSFSHALEQFSQMWYWILILVIGFGIQVGLYSYIRAKLRNKNIKTAKGEIAVSGSASTGSMIACCAHHLVDVLPILGLSAVFLFLAEYQVFFILIGIVSNIIGIIFMLEIIKKHSLHKKTGALNRIAQFNIREVKNWAIIVGILLLLISFFWIRNNNTQNSFVRQEPSSTESEAPDETSTTTLPIRSNAAGNLSIDVKPIGFSFNRPIRFEISLNTHQGNLDFDLTKKSVLVDEKGNQYLPIEWQGSMGGHHLSGKLIFSAIPEETKAIKLIIKNVYNVEEREFLWDLD